MKKIKSTLDDAVDMKFIDRILTAQRKNDSLVCVGLDSDMSKLPKTILDTSEPQFEFNRRIIDATKDVVCAYKPNMAFYEESGLKGWLALEKTIRYIKDTAPEVVVILDAKRGDIGNTAQAYAKACWALGADCVTLNPYLGIDSVEPFLKDASKGAFVLCRTSNASGRELQDLDVSTPNGPTKLYMHVARLAMGWGKAGNLGLVVGATVPSELKDVRALVGNNVPILVPGVGAQGGSLETAVRSGVNDQGFLAIINSSREIIFKDPGPDFAKKAGESALELRKAINQFR